MVGVGLKVLCKKGFYCFGHYPDPLLLKAQVKNRVKTRCQQILGYLGL